MPDKLIGEIRSLEIADAMKAGAIGLLGAIPYAGSPIAAVVGEYASKRKWEKVCDVLSYLHERIKEHDSAPEKHLTPDQVVEIVHETLQAVATASDAEKIEALKHGLGYAFTSEDGFAKKQFLLGTLRATTSIELALLRTTYGHDPYSRLRPENASLTASHITHASAALGGYYSPVVSEDDCGQWPLVEYLASELGSDVDMVEGVVRALDGKGLTRAAPHLDQKNCVIMGWVPFDGVATAAGVTALVARPIKPTPIQASRTKIGEEFVRVFRA